MRWLVLNQRVLAVSRHGRVHYVTSTCLYRKINQNNSKNEKRTTYIFTALMFTLPCPATIDHNPDYLNKASRYFPLVGWIVGSAAFVVLCFNFFSWA
jgi:hypothetical protein